MSAAQLVPDLSMPRERAWSSAKIELREGELGRCVVATGAIAAGEVLIALAHVFVGAASRHTIQLGEGLHQAGTGEIDDYLNHACEPNVALDAPRRCFVAVRAIAPGEELTFNYLSSEWDMAEAFDCRCGWGRCVGKIRGFKHLSPAQQEEIRPLLTPFLRGVALVSLPSAA